MPVFPPRPMSDERLFSPETLQGQWSILYFYPKDATPGCTREAQDFTAHYDEFRALGAEIYGISRDSNASHERFRAKQALPFALVSDSDGAICNAFAVIKEKNLYGRKVVGIERSTFLIDPQGREIRAWRKVKVAGHAEEVLQALRAAKEE